jgi:hypothetical protein
MLRSDRTTDCSRDEERKLISDRAGEGTRSPFAALFGEDAMQVVFNNVNLDGSPVANPDANLVADENRAKAILESMFFNNITLTFNVGLGFNPATRDPLARGVGVMRLRTISLRF